MTTHGSAATLNLGLTKSGSASGTVSAYGKQVTILFTSGEAYVKINSSLLRQLKLPAAACKLVCGKWVKATPSEAKRMTADVTWTTLFGSMINQPVPESDPDTSVKAATLRSAPVWVVTGSAPGSGSVIYVARQGPPYLLRIVAAGQRVDFAHWNNVTIPPPPPASEVVDLSQLAAATASV